MSGVDKKYFCIGYNYCSPQARWRFGFGFGFGFANFSGFGFGFGFGFWVRVRVRGLGSGILSPFCHFFYHISAAEGGRKNFDPFFYPFWGCSFKLSGLFFGFGFGFGLGSEFGFGFGVWVREVRNLFLAWGILMQSIAQRPLVSNVKLALMKRGNRESKVVF